MQVSNWDKTRNAKEETASFVGTPRPFQMLIGTSRNLLKLGNKVQVGNKVTSNTRLTLNPEL